METKFEISWRRVMELTGWSKKGELADFLGITRQSVSGAAKKGKFPLEWAYKVGRAYNGNTDWILDGRGGKTHNEPGTCSFNSNQKCASFLFRPSGVDPVVMGFVYNKLEGMQTGDVCHTSEQKMDISFLAYNLCLDANKVEAAAICSIAAEWLAKEEEDKINFQL